MQCATNDAVAVLGGLDRLPGRRAGASGRSLGLLNVEIPSADPRICCPGGQGNENGCNKQQQRATVHATGLLINTGSRGKALASIALPMNQRNWRGTADKCLSVFAESFTGSDNPRCQGFAASCAQ